MDGYTHRKINSYYLDIDYCNSLVIIIQVMSQENKAKWNRKYEQDSEDNVIKFSKTGKKERKKKL